MNKRETLLQVAAALSESQTKLQRARLWIVLTLLDGPMLATCVISLAKDEGFSKTTLRRAARGIVRHGKPSMCGGWSWELHPKLETLGVNENREALERRLLELCE